MPDHVSRRCLLWLIMTLAASAASAGRVAAEEASLLTQCWSRDELAGAASERTIRRPDRRFDQAGPTRALSPYSPVPAELRGAIRRVKVSNGRKVIALTFDFCESPGEVSGYDAGIVDYLRAEKIPVTFFTGGKWMRSHATRIEQLLADPLFEIANHAEAHRNLRRLGGAALASEIEGPQRSYEAARDRLAAASCVRQTPGAMAAIADRMSLFRFPYGACNPEAMKAVNDRGLLAIQWDVSTGDSSPTMSARAIADSIVSRVRPGSIVLAHANGRGINTASALPLAIPRLRAQGYEFVTVSDLLAQGTPEISATCYSVKPGDTDRYDFLTRAPVKTTPQPIQGTPR